MNERSRTGRRVDHVTPITQPPSVPGAVLWAKLVDLWRRWGVIGGTVMTLLGIAYAAGSAKAQADEVAADVEVLKTLPSAVARLEGKLDALIDYFKIPIKE